MKLRFLVIVIAVNIILLSNVAHAYSTTKGVERGDVVDLNYELNVDGVQQDKGNIPSAKIDSDGGFVEGFWKGVIGAKLQSYKSFSVPPDQGYTNPTDKYYGKTLDFTVYVNKIITDVSPGDSAGGSSSGGALTKVFTVAKWVGLAGLLFLGVFFYSNRATYTTPKCVHCKTMGRDNYAEGTCSKCGNAYCRSSFSRGCPNCKSNSYIPYNK